jgi:hypothetical protein
VTRRKVKVRRSLRPHVGVLGRGCSDLRDVTERVPLDADAATVACARVSDGLIAQVTTGRVVLCSLVGLREGNRSEAEDPGSKPRLMQVHACKLFCSEGCVIGMNFADAQIWTLMFVVPMRQVQTLAYALPCNLNLCNCHSCI